MEKRIRYLLQPIRIGAFSVPILLLVVPKAELKTQEYRLVFKTLILGVVEEI